MCQLTNQRHKKSFCFVAVQFFSLQLHISAQRMQDALFNWEMGMEGN